MHGEKALRERQDVAGAFAQRRNAQGEDGEAVVEVLAKAPGGDFRGQVAVGGGEDAHVEGNRFAAAEALDFLFLQHAQELGLQRERHLGDFVEQQRAVLRLLELAGLGGARAGEGAFLVAEEGGFEQVLGDGGAVDGHERPVVPRGVAVNESGIDFLAYARFAFEEHRGVGLGHAFGQLQQLAAGGVGGDEFVVASRLGVLAHEGEQRRRLEGLEEEFAGAAAHGGHGAGDVAIGGHEGDRQLRQAPAHRFEHFEPIHGGHFEVGEHHGHRLALEGGERLGAGTDGDRPVAAHFQGERDGVAQVRVVLDDEDRQRFAHASGSIGGGESGNESTKRLPSPGRE